jgi:hypothetical protein
MEEENNIIGSLFNSINYRKIEELNKFVDEMNLDQALYCLIQATKYGHNQGLYSIEESEVISKSIRILTNPPEENKEQ